MTSPKPQKGQRWVYEPFFNEFIILDLLDPIRGSGQGWGRGFHQDALKWKVLLSNIDSYNKNDANGFFIDDCFTYLKNQDKPNDLT